MDPIQGQPQGPGWYWVFPHGSGLAYMARVDWVSQGPTSIIPELHCTGYIPAQGDVWFGPLNQPDVPVWTYAESPPPEQTS